MRMVVRALLAAVPALGVLSAGHAGAQMVCGARPEILARLEGTYGESRRSFGLQEGKAVVELYANDETGTWTILTTDTQGRTCLMAAGEGFEAPGFLRISYATSMDRLKEGTQRIQAFIHTLEQEGKVPSVAKA